MPNDPEGLIIERAKWSHFNVTTLAILPESLNSLRVRLSKRIGFKSHIKPEFCQDLSQTQRCKDYQQEWVRFAQNDNNFAYKSTLYQSFFQTLSPVSFQTSSRSRKQLSKFQDFFKISEESVQTLSTESGFEGLGGTLLPKLPSSTHRWAISLHYSDFRILLRPASLTHKNP